MDLLLVSGVAVLALAFSVPPTNALSLVFAAIWALHNRLGQALLGNLASSSRRLFICSPVFRFSL